MGLIFNSLGFLIYFPMVASVYFLLKKDRVRNIWLLIMSWIFYMSWQPGYLLLLLWGIGVAYAGGIWLNRGNDACCPEENGEEQSSESKEERKRGRWKMILLSTALLAPLLFFKYILFLGNILKDILSYAGWVWNVPDMNIMLPVGISFFTFQSLGYLIDIRRGYVPERDFLIFALYISFFPQLVAGPIERPQHLIPQFRKHHRFTNSNFIHGSLLMLCGYILKLLLADHCAQYVDAVYGNILHHNGGSALLAAILFSFQIYGDFAGYSLIAIGAAKIMGFELMRNFNNPYISASVGEFWRRWHISLSEWLRDYIYIPLGGSRKGKLRGILNLGATFIISGIWHGAGWNYILWGAMHGTMAGLEKLHGTRATRKGISGIIGIAFTFIFVTFAWIFFRAADIGEGVEIVRKIFTQPGKPFVTAASWMCIALGLSLLPLIHSIENRCYNNEYLIEDEKLMGISSLKTSLLISGLISILLLFAMFGKTSFIYFQF